MLPVIINTLSAVAATKALSNSKELADAIADLKTVEQSGKTIAQMPESWRSKIADIVVPFFPASAQDSVRSFFLNKKEEQALASTLSEVTGLSQTNAGFLTDEEAATFSKEELDFYENMRANHSDYQLIQKRMQAIAMAVGPAAFEALEWLLTVDVDRLNVAFKIYYDGVHK